MKNDIPVFMFHALSLNNSVEYADYHYAIDNDIFGKLVDIIYNQRSRICSIASLIDKNVDNDKAVSFTFDDGHITNYSMAYPILDKYSASADFFINTAFVGNNGYMNWQQIEEMSRHGMSIQSHGHHHYYFDEISEHEIRNELSISKKTIEDKIGAEVKVFAPPGGRITQKVRSIAFELGYTAISSSRPGVWRYNTNQWDIPRLPVLKNTSLDTLEHWAKAENAYIYKILTKYYITLIVKKSLGNRLYDKLRSKVLES